jgi:chemotaxis protein MotB
MAVRIKNMIPEDDSRVAPIGHPAPPWMVNYADLMTELVCFFVILYALSAALNKNVQNAAEQIKDMMEKGEMSGKVEVNKEGLRITLEEQGELPFFESGKAEITQEMQEKIDKLSPILKKLNEKNEIIVEGHTDNIPIATKQFASNWELSTARATSVVRYMLSKDFDPRKISAIGYGEYRPIVANDTPENRRKNRRVVFFVKMSAIEGNKNAK